MAASRGCAAAPCAPHPASHTQPGPAAVAAPAQLTEGLALGLAVAGVVDLALQCNTSGGHDAGRSHTPHELYSSGSGFQNKPSEPPSGMAHLRHDVGRNVLGPGLDAAVLVVELHAGNAATAEVRVVLAGQQRHRLLRQGGGAGSSGRRGLLGGWGSDVGGGTRACGQAFRGAEVVDCRQMHDHHPPGVSIRTAPHRTAPHRAPHRTAPHRTAPHRTAPSAAASR